MFAPHSDLSGEMRLPPGLIEEGIEDTECRWPQADSEPGDRRGLILNQRQAFAQKRFHCHFLAGVRFRSNE